MKIIKVKSIILKNKIGKTHTMEGRPDKSDERGIIPRAFEHIYRVIEGSPSK